MPALNEELKCTNPHQVPRLEKIVVTTHCGSATDRKQAVEDAVEEISKITGCLLYTSPSPRDKRQSRMPSSA